ncbi:M61 family metallopeptidase [Candidatus Cyanaurora vandensis]|uniref:M61 family metallopeptidase n=1 Tax=Candidatus Cyanaurora vandensis TaxID=2714958 RepID=UPI00257B5862|nr:PDZ domain-containing protein [Candidatus Cyanaurora vandensis]
MGIGRVGLLVWGWLGSAVMAQDLTYTIAMPDPKNHYFDVTVQVAQAPAQPLQWVIPVWTPGSYLVREFARHVQEVQAVDGQGQTLTVTKLNKNTWQVPATSTGNVTLKYRVYANELTVRTSYLGPAYGYFNGANVFPYLEGFQDRPITLVVKPAPGWTKTATGLPSIPGQSNTFLASNYDVLVDSPTVTGDFTEYPFTVRGMPHRLVLVGPSNADPARLTQDTQRLVTEQVNFFGSIPYTNYTFLLFSTPTGGLGGLEHLNSTALTVGAERFRPQKSYREVLGLISHEFFHLWNVKRIRPAGLGPFDYSREVYTPNLWIAEGTTSYYDDLFLRRAGLLTTDDYLQKLADAIKSYRQTPGRNVQTLAQSSFDAWIKYYRPDENSVNSSISYYDKGALVSLMLDLEIRRLTQNRRSLDDVLRLMNANFGQPGQLGYTTADFERVCRQVAGADLTSFFQKTVYSTSELDLEGALAVAGLALKTELSKGEDDRTTPRAYLGLEVGNKTGPALVTRVLSNTPAAQAGLNVGDELLALDSFKVDAANYQQRLNPYSPSTVIQLTIVRNQQLQVLPITLGSQPNDLYKLVRRPQVTPQQRAVYTSWLKETWVK